MAKATKVTVDAVAKENAYQRAAARWLADRLGKDESVVYGVDFEVLDGYQTCYSCDPDDYGSFDTGASLSLTYSLNGRWQSTYWPDLTPGQFIEECIKFLDK